MDKKRNEEEPILLQINLKLPGSPKPWMLVAVGATIFNLFAWGVVHVHISSPFGLL